MTPIRIAGQTITTADDVQRICDESWQEGQQLEFKREDGDDGRTIAAEVVALANHLGGHLIVGIDETTAKPPRAGAVTSVADCAKASANLSRKLWDQIDPPIRGVRCEPVITDDATGAGVIIVEVPQSLFGPHRSKFDREVYQKNGEEKRRLNMTEIHRLVLAFEKREDRVEKRFAKLRAPHGSPFNAYHGALHIRAGAVPLGDIAANLKAVCAPRFIPLIITASNGEISQSVKGVNRAEQRPMIRGIWYLQESGNRNLRAYWFEDGSLQLTRYVRRDAGTVTYASELIETFYSLLASIDNLARETDYPAAEFGIEFQFGSYGGLQLLKLSAPAYVSPTRAREFAYASEGGVGGMLPRYSYLPCSDADKLPLINRFWQDVWNALGTEPPNVIEKIEIVSDEP